MRAKFFNNYVNCGLSLRHGAIIDGASWLFASIWKLLAHAWSPAGVIFFGARIWLRTILGRFSINYFSGLGFRIRVRVWVRVRVRVWVRVRVRVGDRVSVVIWSV